MSPSGRIVLLVTSPRLPAGLLTASAWDLVRTHKVFATATTGQSDALAAAGVVVEFAERGVDALLLAVADGGTAVWLSAASGDERLARELGLRLAREPHLAELELMYGSWDPPGARLLDAVTVTDQLATGDPWRREQTHQSLAKYLLEEAYETYDAIEAHDYPSLREELGDVLLQVVLHARMAEDLPDGQSWTIDDVAGDLVAKLIRRNPHVYGDGSAQTVEEITAQWEQIKATEKAGRSPVDSIALAQPALSLAAKIQSRSPHHSRVRPTEPSTSPEARTAPEDLATPEDLAIQELGTALWNIVAQARAAGLDAEAALRTLALAKLAELKG